MTSAPEFRLKAGDRFPKMQLVLADTSGTPLNLTGCTVALRAKARGSGVALTPTGNPLTIVTPLAGVVEYAWGVAEPFPAGVYDLEAAVTYPGGQVQSVPTSGYVVLVVEGALA